MLLNVIYVILAISIAIFLLVSIYDLAKKFIVRYRQNKLSIVETTGMSPINQKGNESQFISKKKVWISWPFRKSIITIILVIAGLIGNHYYMVNARIITNFQDHRQQVAKYKRQTSEIKANLYKDFTPSDTEYYAKSGYDLTYDSKHNLITAKPKNDVAAGIVAIANNQYSYDALFTWAGYTRRLANYTAEMQNKYNRDFTVVVDNPLNDQYRLAEARDGSIEYSFLNTK